MNKKTLLLLLVGLFVITSVFATQTRMSGLGHPYGLIEDDTDVFTFPATIFKYSGVAVGELQKDFDNTTWSMSANIPILEYKLGVYLNRNTMIDLSDLNLVLGDSSDKTVIEFMDISKSVEFNFGFMDKFALGFGTSADYKAKMEFTDSNNNKSSYEPAASYYSFFGGYSADGMDFGFKVEMANVEDLSAEYYDWYDDEVYIDYTNKYEASYTRLSLNGRHFIMDDDNMTLVVKAGFVMGMKEVNYKYLSGRKLKDIEETDMKLDLGFGMQVKAGEKNKIIFGVTPITYNPSTNETTYYNSDNKYTYKEDDTYLFFPKYNLAVESQICSWLTGRIGANQEYNHITQEIQFPGIFDDDDEEYNSYEQEYSFYEKNYHMNLGLTFSFGKFCVDTVLQQDLLFDGPNFLGGKDNGLATEISVKYKF